MKAKILVCCHKPCDYPREEPYLPIQGGKAISTIDLGIQGDDTGENISEKNLYYNEMTAIYWAWKNLKDVDIIGLCHYRRYFDFHHRGTVRHILTKEFNQTDISIPTHVFNQLHKGEIIIRTPSVLPYSVATYYCTLHQSDDFRTLEQVFKETQSDKMQRAFWEVMHNSNLYSPYHMFIMHRADFEDYCNWLFPLLEELEKRIDYTKYSPYQSRVLGFIGERLLNIYVHAKQMKIQYRPVIWFTDNPKIQRQHSFLKKFVYKTKNRISFWIQKRHLGTCLNTSFPKKNRKRIPK